MNRLEDDGDAAYEVASSICVGERYRLRHPVERFPHFAAPAGAVGVITRSDEDVVALRLDEFLPGAEDWDNEVHWYPVNGDEAGAYLEFVDEARP